MRLLIFKTDKSKLLDEMFDDLGFNYFQCKLPGMESKFLLDQFLDVPAKLVYFDKPARNYLNVKVTFQDVKDFSMEDDVWPDLMIYFDGGDVLSECDWDFLENW